MLVDLTHYPGDTVLPPGVNFRILHASLSQQTLRNIARIWLDIGTNLIEQTQMYYMLYHTAISHVRGTGIDTRILHHLSYRSFPRNDRRKQLTLECGPDDQLLLKVQLPNSHQLRPSITLLGGGKRRS